MTPRQRVGSPGSDDRRIRVARDLLALTAEPDVGPAEGPAELKTALEQDMSDRLPSN